MYYLQETCLKNIYTNRLKVKGWKISYCADTKNHKKARIN